MIRPPDLRQSAATGAAWAMAGRIRPTARTAKRSSRWRRRISSRVEDRSRSPESGWTRPVAGNEGDWRSLRNRGRLSGLDYFTRFDASGAGQNPLRAAVHHRPYFLKVGQRAPLALVVRVAHPVPYQRALATHVALPSHLPKLLEEEAPKRQDERPTSVTDFPRKATLRSTFRIGSSSAP